MEGYRRNVLLLASSQALMMSSNSLQITAAGLVGLALADNPALATLPLAAQFLATMLTSLPASLLMGRIGRRAGFLVGLSIGMVGAVLASLSILQGSFWGFLAGSVLLGSYVGFGNFYRFAAVDSAPADYRGRAVSYVMAGGVVAAMVGPNLASHSRDLVASAPFAASYMVVVGLFLLTGLALAALRIPAMSTADAAGKPRPLAHLLAQPLFVTAVVGAMFGYAVMTLVMTATPLAMKFHEHSFPDTAFVIQWHVLAMFAPAFFTGRIIERFGALPVMAVGALLDLGCVAINLMGTELWHFWSALFLLGIGWNFLFTGGTTLLTETYRPVEKARVQGFNDLLVFTMVTTAALSAGALQHQFGWQAVNIGVIPVIGVILITLAWGSWASRRHS